VSQDLSAIAREIVQRMGDSALTRIVSDLSLKQSGNLVQCPWANHEDNNPSAEWKGDAINCYGCDNKQYNIITHYMEFHCMEFPIAVKTLADELNIDVPKDGSYSKSNYKPKLVKVEASEEYKANLLKVNKPVENKSKFDNWLNSKDISEEAFNVLGCHYSESEAFFNHYEVNTQNHWENCYSKRRMLDMSAYVSFAGAETKELSIAKGIMVFFGLQTLYNSQGLQKSYAFIVEGQTDALKLTTEIIRQGQIDNYAILSIPSGSNTFELAWNNSPHFRKWYKTNCKNIILVPDADEAGLKFRDDALKILGREKLLWTDLTDIDGFIFKKNHGFDVSDLFTKLKKGFKDLIKTIKPLPVEGCVDSAKTQVTTIKPYVWSGFATHDYNDTGLKEGKITLLTGRRGEGKTTLARQMIMSSAMQGHHNFCFLGESSVSDEKGRYSRMCALDGEIEHYENGAGRKIYKPKFEAEDRFNNTISSKITFYEHDHTKGKNIFDLMLATMNICVKEFKTKVFLVDSLMIVTQPERGDIFQEQKRIMTSLVEFTRRTGGHVLLIAHPKSGEGDQKISGATEIENMADTILRYKRVRGDQDFKIRDSIGKGTGLVKEDSDKITAIVSYDKIRDEGTEYPLYLEWNAIRGVVVEMCYTRDAQNTASIYQGKGWFSRSTHKYSESDQPKRENI